MRWWTVLLALAVIAGCSSSPVPLGERQPSVARTRVPLPAGFRSVSYHGIEFGVPSSLPVGHVGWNCGDLYPNTVMAVDPEAVAGCAAVGPNGQPPPPAGATYVEVTPFGWTDSARGARLATAPATVGGRPARIGFGTLAPYPGVTGVLTLADPGVLVAVTAPTRPDAAAILRTVQLAPVDRLGCPAREPQPTATRGVAALAPSTVSAIAICSYASFGRDGGSDDWLLGSNAVPAAQVAGIQQDLDALPAAPPARPSRLLHQYLRLEYPGRLVRWLTASLHGSDPDLTVSYGNRARLAREGSAVWELVYPGSGPGI